MAKDVKSKLALRPPAAVPEEALAPAGRSGPVPHAECRLVLPAQLDIRGARALKQSLADALAGGGPCILEAHAIEKASTVAMQLLMAFFAAMNRAGHPARLRAPSNALRAAAADLGLEGALHTWEMGP